jgi:hypothetical protein
MLLGALSAGLAAVGWRVAQSTAPGSTAQRPASPPITPSFSPEQAWGHAERDAFVPQLQTEFHANTTSLKLVNVSSESRTTGKPGTFSSYSLLFEGPDDFLTEGGVCALQHDALGSMEFFLSPVGLPKNGKRQLEAVFSRKV